MVVDGHGEDALGVVLSDDVIAEALVDRLGWQDFGRFLLGRRAGLGFFGDAGFLTDHVAAGFDAFVADVDAAGSGDQTAHEGLVFGAE